MNKINTLCFSGGGINCFSFLGALNYILSHDIININNIHTYIGTSGGAILAYLLSLNYTTNELITFFINNDINFIKNINISNLFYNYGLDNGEQILLIIKYFLKKKFNKDDITFIELYDLTHNKLIINGTKINNNKIEEILFDKDNSPNMSILLALRISISVPIIYSPIYYETNYYIDGGISNHFLYNYCNHDTTLGFCINNVNLINPLHYIFYNINLSKPKKKYNYKYIIFFDIFNKSEFNISIYNIKQIILYGETICKYRIQNNFNNTILNSTFIYNHINYILFFLFLLFFIYKYLM